MTIVASDTSAGYGVFTKGADCNATPVLIGTVPNGTVIPARGHYLLAGTAYSLSGFVTPNQTLTSNIETDGNVAVFTTANPAGLSSITRLDAVGFGSNTVGNCALLTEGTLLAALGTSTLQHSFFRDSCGKGGNVNTPGLCPSGGKLVDANNNTKDFLFADTMATTSPAGQRLGAPGPENVADPVESNNTVPASLVDPMLSVNVSPNRLRDTTPDPANNATFGTLTINRKFTNNTGFPVTRLRFRIIDVTSTPVTGVLADLRATTSSDLMLPVTGVGTVLVAGTTLDQVVQPMGGASNSLLSVTLLTPLANGASVNVQMKFGLQKTGTFKIYVNVEALP